jgi:hypothetical protein
MEQPQLVHEEKAIYYDQSIPYFKDKYKIKSMETIGLLVGARGTITTFFENFRKRFKLPQSLSEDVALAAIKGSCQLLHNHLYSKNNNN